MNRYEHGERRNGRLLSKTTPLEVRPAVDETQRTSQAATAPQPTIGSVEDDDISGADLDEAWAGLTSALLAADEDFDPAGAYARLSRALPADLVAMPLVEPAAVQNPGDSRHEIRNLMLGLLGMGAVCAALAGLAVFGPGFERRTSPEPEVVQSAPSTTRTVESSLGAGEVWSDGRWEERLLALAEELHAERNRIHDPDRGSLGRVDQVLRDLEREFARARNDFDDRPGF